MSMNAKAADLPPYRPPVELPWRCYCARPVRLRRYMGAWVCICGKQIQEET